MGVKYPGDEARVRCHGESEKPRAGGTSPRPINKCAFDPAWIEVGRGSGKLSSTGHWYRGHGQWAKFVTGRAQVFLGFENRFRCDDLTSVRGSPSHQGQERTVGCCFAIIDGLAFPERSEHLVVLVLVHALFLRVRIPISPLVRAGEALPKTSAMPLLPKM